ncbi:hypothetical protein [Bradyrhizobium sp. MOS003]|uniref:hypothetical protein n=1 Tax=Bradyrhizobium sp. MOS003 TaxID=2133946 RepID=UPI000D1345BC|nr:hypothetical protein [Bradyrhizobium sp. MOS003]PSO19498.1 hypothetical protein C7G42_14685 [Bradyrhizobium sp. MOS003]
MTGQRSFDLRQDSSYRFERIGDGEGEKYILQTSKGFVQGFEVIIDRQGLYIDPFGALDRMREEARANLRHLGLPTDQCKLRPTKSEKRLLKMYPNAQLWKWRNRSGDSYSEADLNTDLLGLLNELMDTPALEPHMFLIYRAMEALAAYRVGKVNGLAQAGASTSKGRAIGPQAKKAKALRIRQIVWRHAAMYWTSRRSCENDASNTAVNICEQVNSELRGVALIGERDRAAKTIGDDIRAGIKSGVFQSGEFGA